MLIPNRRDRRHSRSDVADEACRTRKSGQAVHITKGTPAQPSRHPNISREAQTRRCARVMISEGRSAGQDIRSTDTRTNSRRILLPCCCKERRYCKCKNPNMDQRRYKVMIKNTRSGAMKSVDDTVDVSIFRREFAGQAHPISFSKLWVAPVQRPREGQ